MRSREELDSLSEGCARMLEKLQADAGCQQAQSPKVAAELAILLASACLEPPALPSIREKAFSPHHARWHEGHVCKAPYHALAVTRVLQHCLAEQQQLQNYLFRVSGRQGDSFKSNQHGKHLGTLQEGSDCPTGDHGSVAYSLACEEESSITSYSCEASCNRSAMEKVHVHCQQDGGPKEARAFWQEHEAAAQLAYDLVYLPWWGQAQLTSALMAWQLGVCCTRAGGPCVCASVQPSTDTLLQVLGLGLSSWCDMAESAGQICNLGEGKGGTHQPAKMVQGMVDTQRRLLDQCYHVLSIFNLPKAAAYNASGQPRPQANGKAHAAVFVGVGKASIASMLQSLARFFKDSAPPKAPRQAHLLAHPSFQHMKLYAELGLALLNGLLPSQTSQEKNAVGYAAGTLPQLGRLFGDISALKPFLGRLLHLAQSKGTTGARSRGDTSVSDAEGAPNWHARQRGGYVTDVASCAGEKRISNTSWKGHQAVGAGRGQSQGRIRNQRLEIAPSPEMSGEWRANVNSSGAQRQGKWQRGQGVRRLGYMSDMGGCSSSKPAGAQARNMGGGYTTDEQHSSIGGRNSSARQRVSVFEQLLLRFVALHPTACQDVWDTWLPMERAMGVRLAPDAASRVADARLGFSIQNGGLLLDTLNPSRSESPSVNSSLLTVLLSHPHACRVLGFTDVDSIVESEAAQQQAGSVPGPGASARRVAGFTSTATQLSALVLNIFECVRYALVRVADASPSTPNCAAVDLLAALVATLRASSKCRVLIREGWMVVLGLLHRCWWSRGRSWKLLWSQGGGALWAGWADVPNAGAPGWHVGDFGGAQHEEMATFTLSLLRCCTALASCSSFPLGGLLPSTVELQSLYERIINDVETEKIGTDSQVQRDNNNGCETSQQAHSGQVVEVLGWHELSGDARVLALLCLALKAVADTCAEHVKVAGALVACIEQLVTSHGSTLGAAPCHLLLTSLMHVTEVQARSEISGLATSHPQQHKIGVMQPRALAAPTPVDPEQYQHVCVKALSTLRLLLLLASSSRQALWREDELGVQALWCSALPKLHQLTRTLQRSLCRAALLATLEALKEPVLLHLPARAITIVQSLLALAFRESRGLGLKLLSTFLRFASMWYGGANLSEGKYVLAAKAFCQHVEACDGGHCTESRSVCGRAMAKITGAVGGESMKLRVLGFGESRGALEGLHAAEVELRRLNTKLGGSESYACQLLVGACLDVVRLRELLVCGRADSTEGVDRNYQIEEFGGTWEDYQQSCVCKTAALDELKKCVTSLLKAHVIQVLQAPLVQMSPHQKEASVSGQPKSQEPAPVSANLKVSALQVILASTVTAESVAVSQKSSVVGLFEGEHAPGAVAASKAVCGTGSAGLLDLALQSNVENVQARMCVVRIAQSALATWAHSLMGASAGGLTHQHVQRCLELLLETSRAVTKGKLHGVCIEAMAKLCSISTFAERCWGSSRLCELYLDVGWQLARQLDECALLSDGGDGSNAKSKIAAQHALADFLSGLGGFHMTVLLAQPRAAPSEALQSMSQLAQRVWLDPTLRTQCSHALVWWASGDATRQELEHAGRYTLYSFLCREAGASNVSPFVVPQQWKDAQPLIAATEAVWAAFSCACSMHSLKGQTGDRTDKQPDPYAAAQGRKGHVAGACMGSSLDIPKGYKECEDFLGQLMVTILLWRASALKVLHRLVASDVSAELFRPEDVVKAPFSPRLSVIFSRDLQVMQHCDVNVSRLSEVLDGVCLRIQQDICCIHRASLSLGVQHSSVQVLKQVCKALSCGRFLECDCLAGEWL